MTANCLIQQVKELFLKNIKKGRILSWEELKLNIPAENELEYELLHKWYKTLNQLEFIHLDDPRLEEVFIHNSRRIVYKKGPNRSIEESDITTEDLQAGLDIITLKSGVEWNTQTPFASFDTFIHNKSVRISLIHYSSSPHRISKCFIRILNKVPYNLDNFFSDNNFSFETAIIQKKNILIAGSTGSGKTSFLNSLLQKVSSSEHIIILEDVSEIQTPNKNTTKLLANDLDPQRSLNQYMKYALRMSPDRIILGEMRAKEVESFLLAMNTGHNGLISTIHANSAKDAIERFALLFKIYSAKDLSYELILNLICSNIDYVVFIDNKKVDQIIKIHGSENEQIFYEAIN